MTLAWQNPRLRSAVALALLGVTLMLPLWLAPTPLNDSHAINLVWAHQFGALMATGDLWPRWLPWSHDGLGAPVFYFYGPFAFWLAGLFSLAGFATWVAIAATATLLLIVSGWGMVGWLRQLMVPRPGIGAAFYMAAPYHLLDFTRRGALAEFAAIALLPLVAIGIGRAAGGRPILLATAYAALILSHLPLALLATLFLMPMLVIDHRHGLARIFGAMMFGIAISAAYWLPALALQSATAMAMMRAETFQQPAAWVPADYWHDAVPALLFLMAIGAALAIAAIGLGGGSRWRWHVLAMLALAFGLCGPVWLLPGLDRVQFPWRILALAEFGIAILVGRSRVDGARLMLIIAPLLFLSCLVLAPCTVAIGQPEPVGALARLWRLHPDVPEYLPRQRIGAPAEVTRRTMALARRTPPARTIDGQTRLRRFAFPIWQAQCATRLQDTGVSPEGLIQIPSSCTLVRVTPLVVRLGNLLSIAGIMLLILSESRRRIGRRDPARRLRLSMAGFRP